MKNKFTLAFALFAGATFSRASQAQDNAPVLAPVPAQTPASAQTPVPVPASGLVPAVVPVSAQPAGTHVAAEVAGVAGLPKAPEPAAVVVVVLTGYVTTSAGPLPGAVIKLTESKERVVTDAEGRYHVRVPANTPVQATASYAGYRDQPVTLTEASPDVRLTTPQAVRVARKQRLNKYLKTARKQTRKTVRRVTR